MGRRAVVAMCSAFAALMGGGPYAPTPRGSAGVHIYQPSCPPRLDDRDTPAATATHSADHCLRCHHPRFPPATPIARCLRFCPSAVRQRRVWTPPAGNSKRGGRAQREARRAHTLAFASFIWKGKGVHQERQIYVQVNQVSISIGAPSARHFGVVYLDSITHPPSVSPSPLHPITARPHGPALLERHLRVRPFPDSLTNPYSLSRIQLLVVGRSLPLITARI